MSATPDTLKVLRTDDERRQHPYCQDCKLRCEASGKTWERVIRKCHGIYDDLDFAEISQEAGIPISDVKQLMDPAEWIYQNLGMVPFWYQHRTLKCTSIRKALRWGRRTGKTETIAAYVLYIVFTNARKKVLCVTPHKSQVKEINDRIMKFLNANPKLRADVTRSVQQPYYEIVFANESRIRFFVAGASSGTHAGSQVRGQEADLIFIDEMDYLDDDSAAAILPILSDPDRDGDPVEFISSTTPTGRESIFFNICHNDEYKEFHFPSSSRPDWNEEREAEARMAATTQQGYDHEYMAEWGTKSDGVFRRSDILGAMEKFRYFNAMPFHETTDWPEMKPYPSHWKYIMGVDWNGPGNGTRIAIVGYDPRRNKWILVYREAVSVTEFSLSYAIQRMVELNRIWRCGSAYIDAGFGQMQDETLRAIGRKARLNQFQGLEYEPSDLMWENNLVTVDFGGWITYHTIEDKKEIEKKIPLKNYMVENFQRFFEQKDFWFSKSDEELKQQLLGYSIARQSSHGFPIYKADNESGDHDLDATMLALFGFNQEYSNEFRKKPKVIDFAFIPHEFVQKGPVPDPMTLPVEFQRDKARREQEQVKRPGKYQVPGRSPLEQNKGNKKIIPLQNQLMVLKYRGGANTGRSSPGGAQPKSRTSFLKRDRNGR